LTWLSVAAAAAGGYFGALLGALVAFVFCGIAILVGVAVVIAGGDVWFLNHIALGEWFGPHISFAGGVAAAAFASRRGTHDGGRDIVSGFVGRGDPLVLGVGAVFGVVGLLVQQGLASIDWFDAHADTVALGVVVSAVIARLVFGRTGLFGTPADTSRPRLATTDAAQWLPFQEKPLQAGLL